MFKNIKLAYSWKLCHLLESAQSSIFNRTMCFTSVDFLFWLHHLKSTKCCIFENWTKYVSECLTIKLRCKLSTVEVVNEKLCLIIVKPGNLYYNKCSCGINWVTVRPCGEEQWQHTKWWRPGKRCGKTFKLKNHLWGRS